MTDPSGQPLLFGVGFDIGVNSNCRDPPLPGSDSTYSVLFRSELKKSPCGLFEIHIISLPYVRRSFALPLDKEDASRIDCACTYTSAD